MVARLWSSNKEDLCEETLTKIIKKFKNHSRIIKIKSKHFFQHVSVKDVENVMKNILSNKVSGVDISIQLLK